MDHVQTPNLANPFPGLRPFESHENHLFFGRDGQSNELLRKLRETHFLAVVGTSGSGKSSLVRAGLLPDLYSGMMAGSNSKWKVAVFRPGGDPIDNMARALSQPGVLIKEDLNLEDRQIQEQFIKITLGRSTLGLVEALKQANLPPDENLLVVVDQFEELFRFLHNSHMPNANDQAMAFVKLLLASVQQRDTPIYVVITMRSDYLGDCPRFRDLPEAINEGQYLIPRMTRNQQREAICGPVAVGGAQIAPQLVQRLLNDVGSNPDQLPILQHALMRTWDHWKSRDQGESPINLSDYTAIGGFEGALSLHADKAFAELTVGQSEEEGARRQEIAKKMFKFLTEKGTDNREMRRQALLGDIAVLTGTSPEEVASVVEVFRKPAYSFLMPPRRKLTAETVIDISHESLIRQWVKLRDWVDEEAESSKIFLRLAESAKLHSHNKKDYLFGLELHQYLEWKENFKPDMAWAKRYSQDCELCLNYLEESHRQWQMEKQQKEALIRLAEIRRKKELRRTRNFALILALATLVSILFLVYAERQKSMALAQRDIAQANYQISEAQLQVERDPTVALRLAEIALALNANPLVLNAAHKIYRENVFYKSLSHNQEVYAASFTPDGSKIISGSEDGIARIWELNGNLQMEFTAHEEGIHAVAIAPDGNSYLTGGAEGFARLWDLNGNLLREFKLSQSVTTVAFSEDGRYVLTGSASARLWDLQSDQMQIIAQAQISSAVFSPDGSSVLIASYDKPAGIWDLQGNLVQEFGGESDYIYSVAFSPDGRKILTGSVDGIAKLWDLKGALIQEISGHTNRISSVSFSGDGSKILTSSYDNSIRLWDQKGNMLDEFRGHSNRVAAAAFSPDNRHVVSASYDGTARLWELRGQLIREFKGHSEYIFAVAFSPDGSSILTGSYDHTAALWKTSGGLSQIMKGHQGFIHSVAFSPDGTKVLTGSQDQTAVMWDLAGHKVQEFTGHEDAVGSVAFSPDGTQVLTGSADHTARLWDLEGNIIRVIGKHLDRVSSVSFSPDGNNILTASWDHTARLWDLEGNLLVEFKGHSNQIHAAVFSPDGTKVLTGSGDNTAKLWDLQGNILLDLNNNPGIISSVAFSPDGTKLLTGVFDQFARLWDLQGNLLEQYPGQIFSVAFSPDGDQILVGSGYNAQTWDTVMKLEDFFKSGRIDGLSEEQRKALFTE